MFETLSSVISHKILTIIIILIVIVVILYAINYFFSYSFSNRNQKSSIQEEVNDIVESSDDESNESNESDESDEKSKKNEITMLKKDECTPSVSNDIPLVTAEQKKDLNTLNIQY